MRKILFLLIVSSLFLISLYITGSNVKADIIYVEEGESIQNAIDDANESDTIHVYTGTYNEDITISKSITLEGDDKENTVIIANTETEETIKVSYSLNVVIRNFKIKSKTDDQQYLPVIYLEHSSNCEITDCIIEKSNTGLWLKSSDDNTIESNIIKNNKEDGIIISSYSSDNTVKLNTVQNNNGRGLYIDTTPSGNRIYQNHFLNNDVNAKDMDSNIWYVSDNGNYWSDYNNYDLNGDNKGDTPYTKNGVNDQYPLGYFLNPEPEAFIDSVSPSPATVGQTVTFRGHGSDDGEIKSYRWEADGSIIGSQDEIAYSFSQAKTYTITFKVMDDDSEWSETDSRQLTVNAQSNGGEDPGENQKPIAYIDTISHNSAEYNTEIYFSGHGTDPDGDDIVTYEWSSNYDEIISTESSFYYSDLSVNNHLIKFRVKDTQDKWSDYVSQSLEITGTGSDTNNNPSADAGGPYTTVKDEIVTLDGSKSSDQDGDTITYEWEFGDGSTGTSQKPDHIYSKTGTYAINLTVTDEFGLTDRDSTTITVTSTSQNNNNNNQNNNDNDEENDKIVIPGFETIVMLIGLLLLAIISKKNTKK